MMMQKTAARTYATWNPADKASSITLSNGNLTMTAISSLSTVRSTISKASGKWYWEVTVNSNNGPISGIGTSGSPLNTYSGSAGTVGCGYYGGNGLIYDQLGDTSASIYSTGAILGFALNAATGSCGIYLNNVLQDTKVDGANTWFATAGNRNGGGAMTANFGATAFTYTPPAGYNSGLYN